jgi:predicted aspartyl protease
MHRRLVYFLCFILVISSAAQAHRITIPADVFKAGETIFFFIDLIFPQGPVRALVDTGFAARIRLPKDVAGKLNLPDQGPAFQRGG